MDIRSTRCTVEIVTPSGYKTTFTSDAVQADLLRVETQKDLQNACGAFTLTFAPRRVDGMTWADRIPMRSLVTISMDRPNVEGMPVVNPVVMVGLTDAHVTGEVAHQAVIQRQVTVSGREISCILLDAHLYYHPNLSQSGATVSPLEAGLASTGAQLAWKPDLMQNGLDPRENLRQVLEHFIFGGNLAAESGTTTAVPPREAVINLQLPGRSLSDVLVLNNDAWTTFDEVKVPMAQNTAFAGSIWNYCHINVDQAFQEFFTRVEDGKSLIHFRAKPFVQTRVTTGTRFDDVPTLTTIPIDDTWILSQQLSRVSHSVFNLFEVYPQGTMNSPDSAGYKYLITPAIIQEVTHPSSVQRYGLRVMRVASPYFSAFDTPGASRPGAGAAAAIPPSARIPVESLNPTKAALATQSAQIAEAQGIPAPMIPAFLASMQAESSWNPNAVSPAGAQGVAQLMPATQARFGVTDPFDPVQSVTGGAQYWRVLIGLFGQDATLVAAAYHSGEGAVRRAGNQIPPNSPKTTAYVKRVTALTPNYSKRAVVSAAAIPTPAAPGGVPAPLAGGIPELAERWSKILLAWYEYGPLLSLGRMVLRGHPAFNVGQRLLVNDEMELYVEGVGHVYDFRTGSYTSHLRVTRGWYLDGRTEGIGQRIVEG